MSANLIARDDSRLAVMLTNEADELKAAALECAGLIGRVSNAAEQELAVAAQKELHRVLSLTEAARKAVKEPVLDYGRKIDDTAKKFIAELKEEEIRIARLVGNFQTLELAKARAAEAARLKELADVERRRQEELSRATSHDEYDAIQERANEEAASVPVVTHVKVAGQVVKEDWEIDVSDIWALARAHPMCVKIEPRRSEIKQLLDAGITPAGVKARKVVVSGVRLGRELAAIEA